MAGDNWEPSVRLPLCLRFRRINRNCAEESREVRVEGRERNGAPPIGGDPRQNLMQLVAEFGEARHVVMRNERRAMRGHGELDANHVDDEEVSLVRLDEDDFRPAERPDNGFVRSM